MSASWEKCTVFIISCGLRTIKLCFLYLSEREGRVCLKKKSGGKGEKYLFNSRLCVFLTVVEAEEGKQQRPFVLRSRSNCFQTICSRASERPRAHSGCLGACTPATHTRSYVHAPRLEFSQMLGQFIQASHTHARERRKEGTSKQTWRMIVGTATSPNRVLGSSSSGTRCPQSS